MSVALAGRKPPSGFRVVTASSPFNSLSLDSSLLSARGHRGGAADAGGAARGSAIGLSVGNDSMKGAQRQKRRSQWAAAGLNSKFVSLVSE
jgi:hypothetical protein